MLWPAVEAVPEVEGTGWVDSREEERVRMRVWRLLEARSVLTWRVCREVEGPGVPGC